jgi:hypothetical protein
MTALSPRISISHSPVTPASSSSLPLGTPWERTNIFHTCTSVEPFSKKNNAPFCVKTSAINVEAHRLESRNTAPNGTGKFPVPFGEVLNCKGHRDELELLTRLIGVLPVDSEVHGVATAEVRCFKRIPPNSEHGLVGTHVHRPVFLVTCALTFHYTLLRFFSDLNGILHSPELPRRSS